MALRIGRVPVPHTDHSAVKDRPLPSHRTVHRAPKLRAVGRPEGCAGHPVEQAWLKLLLSIMILVVLPDGSEGREALVSFSHKKSIVAAHISSNFGGCEL